MKIKQLDQVVIPVSDLERSRTFYHEVFDMPVLEQKDGRLALICGRQHLILESVDHPLANQHRSQSGTAAFSFEIGDDIESTIHHLRNYAVKILEEPIQKRSAHGPSTVITIQDPDENLIELVKY